RRRQLTERADPRQRRDVAPLRGRRRSDRGSDLQFALQRHDRHRPRRPSSRGVADRKDSGDFEKIPRGEIENRRRHGTTPPPETIQRRRSPASSTVVAWSGLTRDYLNRRSGVAFDRGGLVFKDFEDGDQFGDRQQVPYALCPLPQL